MAPRIMLMLMVLAFPMGSPNTQKSGDCDREVAQLKENFNKIYGQWKELTSNYDSLQKQLNEAKIEIEKWRRASQSGTQPNDCDQRIAAATEKYRREVEDLNRQIAGLTKKLGDSSKAAAEISSLNKQLDTLRRGAADLENKLRVANQQVEKFRADYQQLSERNASLDNNYSILKSEFSKGAAEIANLNKQLDSSRRGAVEFENKLSAANKDVERYRGDYQKLSEKNAGLDNRYSTLNSEFSNLKNQMLSLTQSRDSLRQQLDSASQQLNGYRSENAVLVSTKSNLDRRIAELERRLNAAGGSVPAPIPSPIDQPKPPTADSGVPADLMYNPAALATWQKNIYQRSAENGDLPNRSYEKDGRIRETTQLVIGTLETLYDPQVRPGKTYSIEATFTPHPILAVSQSPDRAWQLELQYYSSKIKDFRYDREMSGRKEQRREIRAYGPAETWGWEFTAPRDFQKDRSEIIISVGSSADQETLTDIARDRFELTEKETPGAFALVLAFIKDNLAYILGIISVSVAIWATLISIKKSKLEVRLKEMELEPKS